KSLSRMSLLACLCLRRIVRRLCMSVTSIPVDFVGYDIAIMGSGYAGLMAALRLARPAWQLRIALINARDQFIERVRLQESIIEATAYIQSIFAIANPDKLAALTPAGN